MSRPGRLSWQQVCARNVLLGLAGTSLAITGASRALAQSPLASPQGSAEKPIIPQDRFDAAIPPLPPANAGEAPEPAPPQPPAEDPELDRPLQPLSQFNANPPDQLAAEASDKAPTLRYGTRVEGLDEPDKKSTVNLTKRFNELSALRAGKGKAANQAMLSARLKEDSQLLQRLMFSEGWYDAGISTRIDREPGRTGELTAVLSVSPGMRYTLGEIRVVAGPTQPPGLIERSLALQSGEPLVAERIQGAEANIALVLPQNGYAFAETGKRDVELDPETHLADYTLPVTVGPRGRFGDITTHGKLAFSARHAQVIARFKRGELYDSRKLDDLRKALLTTGLFASVSAEPVRTDKPAPDETEYVDIDVEQHAGPPRTIAADLGYGSGEGFRVRANWTHRNLFPPEGAVIAQAALGTQEQSLGATFRRANAGQRDRTIEFAAEAFRSDYEAYSAYTGRLAARISRDSTPLWQKRLTYSLGVEVLATGETDYDAATRTRPRQTYYVAAGSAQLGFDTTDSLLNPTAGYRLTTLIQPEATLNQGFNSYARARIEASAYQQVGKALVLAGRVRIGTIQGAELADIAPSRRLYAGGGGSVRGFAFQSLGEQAPDGRPVGGRSLAEGSLEARYRVGDYGMVAFIDAGQAWRETTPQFNDLRYGVGIGGRFYTNFGPVRLDVATPLARRPGEALINVYVSIGQAF